MPKRSKCVASLCGHCQERDKGCIYAKFPKSIERCRMWLKAIGESDLVHLPHEKLQSIRYVCGCHFTDDQFSNATRKHLKKTAVPSLFDDRTIPLNDNVADVFPITKDSVEEHVTPISTPEGTVNTGTYILLNETPAVMVLREIDQASIEVNYAYELQQTSADIPLIRKPVALDTNGAQEVDKMRPLPTQNRLILERLPLNNDVSYEITDDGHSKRHRPSEQFSTTKPWKGKMDRSIPPALPPVPGTHVLTNGINESSATINSERKLIRLSKLLRNRVDEISDIITRISNQPEYVRKRYVFELRKNNIAVKY